MLYATILHSIGGAVAGSMFRVRILFFLSGVVVVEATVMAFVNIQLAGLWTLTNLFAMQGGYLAGIFIRRALEIAGISAPPANIHGDTLP